MSFIKTKTPSPRRGCRHSRKRLSDEFSIEELSLDDMGYDADVEIIRPDKYEEVDSESDDAATPQKDWHSIDDELATRMRQLGRGHSPPSTVTPDRSRKRQSVEMDLGDKGSLLGTPRSPELEVQEIVDGIDQPSPAKRRRKKSRWPHANQYLLRSPNQVRNDSSENQVQEVSSPSTPSGLATPGRDDDDEMVDVV